MAPTAWVETADEVGVKVLLLYGELDMSSRGLVEPSVLAAITSSTTVVLDLDGVTFCDSNGIGLLMTAHKKAIDEAGALSVRNARPPVRRLLGIAGVAEILGLSG